ncbi:MAG: disulfide oxidoreductase [Gemmatimonadota bacterium]
MAFYATIVTTLAILTIVAVVLAIGLGVALVVPGARARLTGALVGQARHPVGWAFMVALIGMLGSLYLSEIARFVPCELCWFQRIAMYPLVAVLGVGLLRGESGVWRYALPLPVIGVLISIYHVVIQWQPNLEVTECTTGVPCTGRYLQVMGFVSIPTMAGAAFLLITVLLMLVRTLEKAGAEA